MIFKDPQGLEITASPQLLFFKVDRKICTKEEHGVAEN